MSLQVTITITGSDRVRQKMLRLGSSLYDFKDAMGQIGLQGARYFAGPAWLSQGGVFGNKWAALSPKYAAWKAKHYPGRNVLVREGNMQHEFDYKADRNSVFIGNRAPQFKYHQSTLPRSRMPRRQMIGVSSGFKTIVGNIIKADIERKIREA